MSFSISFNSRYGTFRDEVDLVAHQVEAKAAPAYEGTIVLRNGTERVVLPAILIGDEARIFSNKEVNYYGNLFLDTFGIGRGNFSFKNSQPRTTKQMRDIAIWIAGSGHLRPEKLWILPALMRLNA